MKKTFYMVHIEVERNIGNYDYTLVFKTLDEAKATAEEINAYHGYENISKRDSYAYKITRHAFSEKTNSYNNKNYAKFEEAYFTQHSDFAYGE